jgi:probable rRNA maturation factor
MRARKSRSVRISVRSLDGRRGPDRKLLEKAIAAGLEELPDREYAVEVVYANDAAMKRLNSQFHGKKAVTDVLAFPAHQELPGEGYLLGEVIVNRDEAVRRSGEGGGVSQELLRYVVHGVLHMVGHDDATPKLSERMWQRQEQIVAMVSGKVDR